MTNEGGTLLSNLGTVAVLTGVSGVAVSAMVGGLPIMAVSAIVTGLGATLTFFGTREEVKEFQEQLKEQGFYNGPINGSMNEETVEALRQFQQAHNFPVTGVVNWETRQAFINNRRRAA